MLDKSALSELSFKDRVIISEYLDNVAEGIKKNLKTMNLSGFGASYSSGRSSEFEIKEIPNGAQLWGEDYLYELEYPLSPSEQRAKNYSSQWAGIREWINEKPIIIEEDISADQLAGLITRSIREKGTLAFQKYGSNATGIVSSAITEKDINELINNLGDSKLESLIEFLMHEFEQL